jgi:hypothetical protein
VRLKVGCGEGESVGGTIIKGTKEGGGRVVIIKGWRGAGVALQAGSGGGRSENAVSVERARIGEKTWGGLRAAGLRLLG